MALDSMMSAHACFDLGACDAPATLVPCSSAAMRIGESVDAVERQDCRSVGQDCCSRVHQARWAIAWRLLLRSESDRHQTVLIKLVRQAGVPGFYSYLARFGSLRRSALRW